MLKKILFFSLIVIALSSCAVNDKSHSDHAYWSCSIVESFSKVKAERENDISQCFGMKERLSEIDAKAWCLTEVQSYLNQTYLVSHTVRYRFKRAPCP